MITGYDLINKYYESEKLYSTGDSELDDLLEKAFCEGYEYAQREFAKKEDEDEDSKEEKRNKRKVIAKKVAKGAGIAAGTTLAAVGGYQGVRGIQKYRSDKATKGITDVNVDAINMMRHGAGMDDLGGYHKNRLDKFGAEVQRTIKRGAQSLGRSAKRLIKKNDN